MKDEWLNRKGVRQMERKGRKSKRIVAFENAKKEQIAWQTRRE